MSQSEHRANHDMLVFTRRASIESVAVQFWVGLNSENVRYREPSNQAQKKTGICSHDWQCHDPHANTYGELDLGCKIVRLDYKLACHPWKAFSAPCQGC